jgi:hypothetical protein
MFENIVGENEETEGGKSSQPIDILIVSALSTDCR